jgi:hypothetical protein
MGWFTILAIKKNTHLVTLVKRGNIKQQPIFVIQ